MKLLKYKKSKIIEPQRFTFTFSNSPELNQVVNGLEERLMGMNRAEIVKLALVEFYHNLNQQNPFSNNAYCLTSEQENSLEESLNSPSILVDLSQDDALDKFLNQVKKEYV